MKRTIFVMFTSVLFLAMTTSPVQANGSVSSANGGATAQFLDAGDKMKLCDTRADGNPVYYTFRATKSNGNNIGTDEKRLHTGNGTCKIFDYDFPESANICYRSYISDRGSDTAGGIKCAYANGKPI